VKYGYSVLKLQASEFIENFDRIKVINVLTHRFLVRGEPLNDIDHEGLENTHLGNIFPLPRGEYTRLTCGDEKKCHNEFHRDYIDDGMAPTKALAIFPLVAVTWKKNSQRSPHNDRLLLSQIFTKYHDYSIDDATRMLK